MNIADELAKAYNKGLADGRADAQPIVHGRWISEGKIFNPKCSVCGNYAEKETPYCPHCGAKMDGDIE